MNTATDFPVDPELIAAVESALRLPALGMVPFPEPWAKVQMPKRKSINSDKRKGRLARVLKRDCGVRQCFYCHRKLPAAKTTLDHLVPYRIVRSWEPKFLVQACGKCNQAKKDDIPAVLMPLLALIVLNHVLLSQRSAAAKAARAAKKATGTTTNGDI